MIFLHRQNNSNTPNAIYHGVECDVRTYKSEMYMNHDIITDTDSLQKTEDFTKSISKNLSVIFNVKESGLEESLMKMSKRLDYYFLDSQIPDIIRLSKKYPKKSHKFILRVSDVEPFPKELINLVKPKYMWLDWSNFEDFDLKQYSKFINKTIKKLYKYDIEPIIVSPELYSLDNINLIDGIIDNIKGKVSVCTKLPEYWSEFD